MGKPAARDGLKLIKIKNVPSLDDKRATFEGGVLALQRAYAQGASAIISDKRNPQAARSPAVAAVRQLGSDRTPRS